MNRGKFLPKLVTPDAEHRMKRKFHPCFENLFWKKVSADSLPHTFKFLQSEVWVCLFFFPQYNSVFLHLGKKNEVLLTNVFHLFPHVNGFGKKSPRRLKYPPAESSVKQLRRYYSLSCPWWKQCHSYASVGNKGAHSSGVIQFFVPWLSLQTQKAGDKLMFNRTAET